MILALEATALLGATVFFVIELFVDTPGSVASAVALAVIVGVATVWVVFIILGALRGQAWTRAAIVVLQILVGAVAIGSFQGPEPRPDLGMALLAPAVLALVLLFQRPVTSLLIDREDRAL